MREINDLGSSEIRNRRNGIQNDFYQGKYTSRNCSKRFKEGEKVIDRVISKDTHLVNT